MAQDKDLSGAEELDLNFSIEETQSLEENELGKFLDSEESVTGNSDDVTHTDDDSVPAGPAKKAEPKKQPTKKEPSKEELDAEKHRKEEEEDFDEFLEEDEIDLTKGKKNPSKKVEAKEEDEHEDDTHEDEGEDEGIKAFAEDLYKIGFFTKAEDDEEAPSNNEELLEKLQEEKQRGAEELVDELAGRHGEEYREAFYKMFVDGVHPKEYLGKFFEVQDLKSLDMTDEANQVRVVETGMRKQGWEEEDIKEEIHRLKTNSDLETVSGKYHKALVKAEEADMNKMAEAAKANAARLDQADVLYRNNVGTILNKAIKDKELNGIPITKDLAQKAFDMAYTKKWTLPKSKESITDLERIFLESKKPENHAFRTQLAALIAQTFEGWDSGKPLTLDLTKIQKKAVSNENTELFTSLVRNKKQNGIGNVVKNKKPSNEKYDF